MDIDYDLSDLKTDAIMSEWDSMTEEEQEECINYQKERVSQMQLYQLSWSDFL